jgi:steroid 5-alpha reductase family enzyme
MVISIQGWPIYAVLFGLTLLVTALGFRKLVYFVSIGYTFAIVLMSLFSVLAFRASMTWFSSLHILLLVVWGLRLGMYLLRRESASTYQNERDRVETQYKRRSPVFLISIWLAVSILYVLMFLPAFLNVLSGAETSSPASVFWQILGLVFLLVGLVIETLADQQKSVFKTQNPNQFCATGLYSWVRCPNYLGEIIFWVGNWIMGIAFFNSILAWVCGLIGTVCLILIMVGSAKRLEASQTKRYGELESYQTYVRTVPVLFPFLPIFTLKDARIVID